MREKKYPVEVSFRLTRQQEALIKFFAERESKTQSEWMREAVAKFLHKLEEDPEFRKRVRVENFLRRYKWVFIEEGREPLVVNGRDLFP